MTTIRSLAVVGVDDRTKAIANRLSAKSPFQPGPLKLVSFSAGPEDVFAGEAEELAVVAGVPLKPWQSAVCDVDVDGVYAGGPYAGRARVVVEALRAGKPVLCPLPAALSGAELDEIEGALGDGILLTPADMRFTIAGRQALQVVSSGTLGPIHAVYGAIRARRDPGARMDVLDDLGWELLDYAQAIAGSHIERVYAAGGRLFPGLTDDSMMLNMRCAGDTLITLEIARALPPAAPKGYDADFEVTGRDAALRVEPYKYDVNIVSEQTSPSVQAHSWHLHPVIDMLEEFEKALSGAKPGPGVIAYNRALIRTVAMIRRSLETRDAVTG